MIGETTAGPDPKYELVAVWSRTLSMVSCGTLGVVTTLAFTGVGCVAFEDFEPIQLKVARGGLHSRAGVSES